MKTKDFYKLVDDVKKKIGKELLSDEELLIMTAFEISRSYTREEKKYSV